MIFTEHNVSSDSAMALVTAVIAEAGKNGWKVAVAVVDTHGDLLAAQRMDGVPAAINGFARDKAYTAAMTSKTTKAFGERMASSDGLRLGLSTRDRLITWGGGLPIFLDGACVGGIGVSGAQDFEDIACAEAALKAVGFGTEA